MIESQAPFDHSVKEQHDVKLLMGNGNNSYLIDKNRASAFDRPSSSHDIFSSPSVQSCHVHEVFLDCCPL